MTDTLYTIPQNWRWTTLENIADWGSGGTPSRKNPEYYTGNIAWIKTGELNNGYIYESEEHITVDALQKSSAKLYPKNSILIAMYGATIGKVGILGIEATTNQACACAICHSNIYFKYLFYYVLSQKENFIRKSKGGAQPNISQEIIKKFQIPLPPLAEQKRIVERLDSLFAKLDAAKKILQDIVDGYEIRRAAILHRAFTGKLTADFRKINNLSLDDWQEKTLGEITNVKSSKRIFKNEYVKDGIPFFRGSEIVELNDSGKVTPQFFISENRYNEIVKQNDLPKERDILITSVGTIGKTWIVDNRKFYYKDGNIILIERCEKINPSYLRFYIQSNFFQNDIKFAVSGSAYNALTIVKLKRFSIPLPPLEEQKEIARLLDNFITKENRVKEIAEKSLSEIDALKKKILARAFRGELGTNDPSENAVKNFI